jgi:hypothetical protein
LHPLLNGWEMQATTPKLRGILFRSFPVYEFITPFGIEPVIINITFKTCASLQKFSFKKVLPVMVLPY